MKYKFCGDMDPPDWLIGEIALLARVSAVRLRVIANTVCGKLTGKNTDIERAFKMIKDSGFNIEETKAALGSIHFILSTAGKFQVEPEELNEELQQLGLPSEIANSLTRAYTDAKEPMRSNLSSQFLQLNRVVDMEWRVDQVIAASFPSQATIGIKLQTTQGETCIETTPTHLMVLTQELRKARNMMDGYDLESSN